MIRALVLGLMLVSVSARADEIVVMGSNVYAVKADANGPVTAERLQGAQFLSFKAKGAVNERTWNATSVAPLAGLKWLEKSRKPNIPEAEGCGHYPKTWMETSQIVATVKAPATTYQLEVPPGYEATKLSEAERKALSTMLDYLAERCLASAKAFASGTKRRVYCTIDDDLNPIAAVYVADEAKSWTAAEKYVLDENCP